MCTREEERKYCDDLEGYIFMAWWLHALRSDGCA